MHPAAGCSGGRHAIGIDVGGTKIAGAVVDTETGAISARRQVPTEYGRGGEAVLQDVARMARMLQGEAAARGFGALPVGLGVAELVSPEGKVFSGHRIAWQEIDVGGRLTALLGVSVTVTADVMAAALAEARHGAGFGVADFYFVAIGTGVSGVLVRDGRPYRGSRGAALVIASARTDASCPVCGHRSARVVEDVASGPAIAAAYGAGRRAEDVVAAAEAGDARAIGVIDHAAAELGRVVALMVNALDPALVVVGGGLGSAPGRYAERLRRAIRAGLWEGDSREMPIVPAALGADAGLIGAAASTLAGEGRRSKGQQD